MFLLCLVYLLLEYGDAVGAQSFLTKTPYGTGTVGLRVCDFAMCVEKQSKTLKTPQTWKIGWLVLYRTHEVCFHT